ncbi:MAG: MoaD/ThiS family protein [Chloroflexi bacterium]|nr:MoaD/ThiS family protein [Chloroflexota bacterium]
MGSETTEMIEVHLYGKLRRYTNNLDPSRDSVIRLPAAEAETIQDIIRQIGIPREELGNNVFLNGEYSDFTRKVKAGDRLGIFPDDMQLLYKWHFNKKEE